MMQQDKLLAGLKTIVGEEHVLTSLEDLITYAYNAIAPIHDELPLAVVSPGDRKEISALLHFANKWNIPIVPCGSGTGLAGASIPTPGSVVLLTRRLNRILEIDEANLTALVARV